MVILMNAVSPKAVQCEAFSRRHSGALRREETPKVGALGDKRWAAFGLTRRAISRPPSAAVHWLDVEHAMPASVRLAESSLISAASINITMSEF